MTTAAADLGASKGRIDMQNDFVSNLMDAIDRGIGTLVDADMTKESTLTPPPISLNFSQDPHARKTQITHSHRSHCKVLQVRRCRSCRNHFMERPPERHARAADQLLCC